MFEEHANSPFRTLTDAEIENKYPERNILITFTDEPDHSVYPYNVLRFADISEHHDVSHLRLGRTLKDLDPKWCAYLQLKFIEYMGDISIAKRLKMEPSQLSEMIFDIKTYLSSDHFKCKISSVSMEDFEKLKRQYDDLLQSINDNTTSQTMFNLDNPQ